MAQSDEPVILTQNALAMRWRAFERAFGLGLRTAFDLPADKPEDQLVDLLRMADARRSEPPAEE
jgi:hypothetical protein